MHLGERVQRGPPGAPLAHLEVAAAGAAGLTVFTADARALRTFGAGAVRQLRQLTWPSSYSEAARTFLHVSHRIQDATSSL